MWRLMHVEMTTLPYNILWLMEPRKAESQVNLSLRIFIVRSMGIYLTLMENTWKDITSIILILEYQKDEPLVCMKSIEKCLTINRDRPSGDRE